MPNTAANVTTSRSATLMFRLLPPVPAELQLPRRSLTLRPLNPNPGRNNCGRCDQICAAADDCVGGECQRRKEVVCDNGLDDDGDGKTDCEDRAGC